MTPVREKYFHVPNSGVGYLYLFLLCSSDGSLPWHRVHAVSPEGPVGQNGIVQPGDHLVEVNSQYSVNN